MPQLTNKETGQPEKVTARFTERELALVKERAAELNLSPSAFARQAILSAVEATAIERLTLAKLCKQEELLLRLFGGLFAQLNEKEPFGRETFKLSVEAADKAQYGKADALLALYRSMTGRENGKENGANGKGYYA
jgi:hypothetical protein